MKARYVAALEDYAAYHRDFRNKLTHYIGIPMIVFAIVGMLQRVALFDAGTVTLDLALVVMGLTTLYYLSLNLTAGIAMALAFIACYLGATYVPLKIQFGLFVLGWVFQFIGHYFEGKKPAFLKNGVHLLIGPVWIMNDALKALHLPAYAPAK